MDKWCGSSFHQKTLTCFKLPSQKIFLKRKLITNLAILNKWNFFSGMVDKWVINYENGIISWYFDFYLCQNSIFL